MNDAELDELYRRAGASDRERPSATVRARILAHAARIAATREAEHTEASSSRQRAARNHARLRSAWAALRAFFSPRSQWRIIVPLTAALVAAVILVPMRHVPAPPRSAVLQPEANSSALAVRNAPVPAPSAPAPASSAAPQPAEAAPQPPELAKSHRYASSAERAVQAPRPSLSAGARAEPRAEAAPSTPALAPPGATSGAPATAASDVSRARESLAARRSSSPQSLQSLAGRMQQAAAEGSTAGLAACLDEDPALLETRDFQGRTPLMLATLNGRRDAVTWLLAKGADPNAADRSRHTPLEVARARGDAAISAALIDAGARAAP